MIWVEQWQVVVNKVHSNLKHYNSESILYSVYRSEDIDSRYISIPAQAALWIVPRKAGL